MKFHGQINLNFKIAVDVFMRRLLQYLNTSLKGGSLMTSMQVEYSKLKEQQRHNVATELQQVAELQETKSYHAGQLYLSGSELDEKIRHNIAEETELMRSHMVSEQEINRHNKISEALQQAANETNRYVAELNAQTNVTTTQMRNWSAEQQTMWTNSSKETIAKLDRAQTAEIKEAERMIEWYKAQTNDAKVRKEIELLQKDIDNYNWKMSNATKQANAAWEQALTAQQNAETNAGRLEEDKYMHDWQMKLDKYYADLAQIETNQKGWATASKSVSDLLRAVTGAVTGNSGSDSSSQGKTAQNTLGGIINAKSKSKKVQ